jgi:hypothetical protein
VEVLDSRNHVLSPLSYVSMGLKAHMHDTRLDWVGPLNLTATQALIHVKCASPGVGSLHAAMATDAASGGKALRSNPAQIQVCTEWPCRTPGTVRMSTREIVSVFWNVPQASPS